jgi:hypothetical protein
MDKWLEKVDENGIVYQSQRTVSRWLGRYLAWQPVYLFLSSAIEYQATAVSERPTNASFVTKKRAIRLRDYTDV